mgnify:CR=1 FL=1
MRSRLLAPVLLDHLDHAPTLQFFGGKIGIDATAKGPAEGTREWPEEIAMMQPFVLRHIELSAPKVLICAALTGSPNISMNLRQ